MGVNKANRRQRLFLCVFECERPALLPQSTQDIIYGGEASTTRMSIILHFSPANCAIGTSRYKTDWLTLDAHLHYTDMR